MSTPVIRPLLEAAAGLDPLRLFDEWFTDAAAHGVAMPEAMILATATTHGVPSVRTVLLRGHGADGFRFFTDGRGRKAGELIANPRGALLFGWSPVGRQVRVDGPVVAVAAADCDAYFAGRPRGSQIGAWASTQSAVIPSRAVLEAEIATVEARFAGVPVPRPPYWGGWMVVPETFEFWQQRDDRLHDRLLFRSGAGAWAVSRLAP
jgi:pyridoxamine 5'-phosphate oxidase